MSLTFDVRTLGGIHRTQTVLLSPWVYPDLHAWGTTAIREVMRVIGADAGVFSFPTADGRAFVSPDYPVDAASDYPFRMVHLLPDVWPRQVALGVHAEGEVWAPVQETFHRSGYFNEVRVPLRAFNAGGMTVLPGGAPGPDTCAQIIVHRRTKGRPQNDRERGLYTLLFAAFEAGCALCPAPPGHPRCRPPARRGAPRGRRS